MKHWMMGAAVLMTGIALAATSVCAAPQKRPAPAPGVRAGAPPMAANPLNLTPEQQTKVRELTMKMQPEMMQALQGAKSQAERMSKLEAIQRKFEPSLMKILTPAQRAKLKTMQAEGRRQMKEAQARAKAAPKK